MGPARSSLLLLFVLYLEINAQMDGSPPPRPPPPTCPATCNCREGGSPIICNGGNAQQLSFEHMGLTMMPVINGSYPFLERIDLEGNFLTRIETGSFTTSNHTPALRSIDLSRNQLRVIESEAFSGALESINLEDNRISTIEMGAFSGSLEVINLKSNELVAFQSRSFNRIESTLELLDLQENGISSFIIDPSFNSVLYPHLILDLSHNPIFCNDDLSLTFVSLCENFFSSFDTTQAECLEPDGLSLAEFCTNIGFTPDDDSTPDGDDEDEDSEDIVVSPFTDSRRGEPDSTGLTIGLATGVPVAVIVLLVVTLVILFVWRSRMWERRFKDVTEAQVEADYRMSKTLRSHSYVPPNVPPPHSPRYATGPFRHLPETPPPPYNQDKPCSSTVFFNCSEDHEGIYDSIEGRPLPDEPSVEYEDGYILRVDSAPKRDVLPGIAIAKRREEEARRLSMYKAHEPRQIVPTTNSDSETESEIVESPTTHFPSKQDASQENIRANYQNVGSGVNQEGASRLSESLASGTPAILVTDEASKVPPEMLSEDEDDEQEVYLPVIQ